LRKIDDLVGLDIFTSIIVATIMGNKTSTQPPPPPPVPPTKLQIRALYEEFAYKYIAELIRNGTVNELPYITKYKHLMIILACPPNCKYTVTDTLKCERSSVIDWDGYKQFYYLKNDNETRYCKNPTSIIRRLLNMGLEIHHTKFGIFDVDCYEFNHVLKFIIQFGIEYLNKNNTKMNYELQQKYDETKNLNNVEYALLLNDINARWNKEIMPFVESARKGKPYGTTEIIILLNKFVAKLVTTDNVKQHAPTTQSFDNIAPTTACHANTETNPIAIPIADVIVEK
jgi:hypothetical protein